MKRTSLILMTAAVVLISASGLGQNGGYIVVNSQDPTANSAESFAVSAGGTITQYKTLQTGGTASGAGFFATPQVAIESSGHCLFVADSGSSDIAAFRSPSTAAWFRTSATDY